MSSLIGIHAHIDTASEAAAPLDATLAWLGAVGFRALDEASGEVMGGGLSSARFLARCQGTDRGLGVVGRGDLELHVAFRACLTSSTIQTVALSVGGFYANAGPRQEERISRLTRLALGLHRTLDARRTLVHRGLEDGWVPYDWQAEWTRLDQGRVEGSYWVDIVRSALASEEYERTRRESADERIFLKRFPWGVFSRVGTRL